MVKQALILLVVLFLIQAEDPTSADQVEDAFGVPLETLRDLVFKQPFVSSCQYSILKNVGMYNTAKQDCQRKLEGKGKIAAIRNERENQAIANLFVATFGHGIDNKFMRNNPSNYLWIGLSRKNNDDEWKWEDQYVPYNYTNWKKNHPKDGYYHAVMNKEGHWISTTNINYHPTVCERAAKYVVYRKRLEYEEAYSICSNMSMSLAKVMNESENAELARIASRSLGSPYLEKNFQNVNQLWIGGYEGDDGKMYWEDGSEIEYQNFEPQIGLEFSGTGNVKITLDKLKRDWRLEKASEERSFACQCLNPGRDQYNDFSYYNNEPEFEVEAVVDKHACKKRFYPDTRLMTFGEARLACLKQGLQLAKIDSQEDNDFALKAMNKAFKGTFQERLFDGSNWFWIGGTDDMIEGHFVWQDNTPLNYTNWGANQPDNAHPLRGGQSKIAVYRATGHWDDGHASRSKAFLCYNEDVSLDEEIENACDDFGNRLKPDDSDSDYDDSDSDYDDSDSDSDKSDSDETEDGTEIIDEDGTEEIDEEDDSSEEKSTPDSPKADIVESSLLSEYIARKDCIRREYHGSYYVSTTIKTYDEAKRDCEQRGMELATIYHKENNARLRNMVINRVPVSAYVLATMGELSWFWVGLGLNEQDQPVWQTGNHTTYENFASYYKRNKFTKESNTDVLAVSKVDGSWEWKRRDNKYMYVCQEVDKWVCVLFKDLNIYEDVCIGMYEERTLYTYHLNYVSLAEARQTCNDTNTKLAFPTSISENEELRSYAERQYPLPQTIKVNPSNKENWIWIDIDDMEEEGNYKYGNGSEVGWFNWGTKQPDNKLPRKGGQDLIALNKNTGKWFDVSEDRQLQFLCQRKVWQCVVNENLYGPTEKPTTSPTEPTTPSPEDVTTANPISNDLEFIKKPVSYLVNTGSSVTFQASFQPEHANIAWMMGGRRVMNTTSTNRIYISAGGDLVVSSVQYEDEGVVSCIVYTDRYEIVANAALTIAEQKLLKEVGINADLETSTQLCNELGGDIASPNTEDENKLIYEHTQGKEVWLGISAAGGHYVLQDGSALEYFNWNAGEPVKLDGDSGVVMDGAGKWSVKSVSQVYGTICQKVPLIQGDKKHKRQSKH